MNRPVNRPVDRPVDLMPTLSNTDSAWEQGANRPLTGDRFTVPPPLTTADCELSVTTVNGQAACKGHVVFEEDWRTLNLRRWEYEVKISGPPVGDP